MSTQIASYTPTPTPPGFSVYGYKPEAIPCSGGWVQMLLGSYGDDKSSFYTRVWFWVSPFTSLTEKPLPYHVYHASLAPVGSLLFVFGIAVFGVGYQHVPDYVPYAAPAVLTMDEPALPLLSARLDRRPIYQGMIDDLWTAHRRQQGWTRRQAYGRRRERAGGG